MENAEQARKELNHAHKEVIKSVKELEKNIDAIQITLLATVVAVKNVCISKYPSNKEKYSERYERIVSDIPAELQKDIMASSQFDTELKEYELDFKNMKTNEMQANCANFLHSKSQ